MFIYWFFIMDILKGTDEQPDEELHLAKSGRIPAHKLLSLWSWGTSASQHGDMFTNLDALPTL